MYMRGVPLLILGNTILTYFPDGICLQAQMNVEWGTTSDGVLVVFSYFRAALRGLCIHMHTHAYMFVHRI